MASLIPEQVSKTLTTAQSGLEQIGQTVQAVDSIWKQLSGQSESVPAQRQVEPVQLTAAAPAPAQTGITPTTLAIGAGVILVLILVLR